MSTQTAMLAAARCLQIAIGAVAILFPLGFLFHLSAASNSWNLLLMIYGPLTGSVLTVLLVRSRLRRATTSREVFRAGLWGIALALVAAFIESAMHPGQLGPFGAVVSAFYIVVFGLPSAGGAALIASGLRLGETS
jgi:hypothetical protein